MSCFYLNLEVAPEADISDTCKEAVRISRHLDIDVNFKFNGVTIGARPFDDWKKIIRAYDRELKGDHQFKIAYGND